MAYIHMKVQGLPRAYIRVLLDGTPNDGGQCDETGLWEDENFWLQLSDLGEHLLTCVQYRTDGSPNSPEALPGVHIVVAAPGPTFSWDSYDVRPPMPVPTAGYLEFPLIGDLFDPDAVVALDGEPLTITSRDGSWIVYFDMPPHVVGDATLTLTNPDGRSASTVLRFMEDVPPSVGMYSFNWIHTVPTSWFDWSVAKPARYLSGGPKWYNLVAPDTGRFPWGIDSGPRLDEVVRVQCVAVPDAHLSYDGGTKPSDFDIPFTYVTDTHTGIVFFQDSNHVDDHAVGFPNGLGFWQVGPYHITLHYGDGSTFDITEEFFFTSYEFTSY